jgi:hypothetical protein
MPKRNGSLARASKLQMAGSVQAISSQMPASGRFGEGFGSAQLTRLPSLTAVALPRPRGRALLAYAVPVVRSAPDLLQCAKAVIIIVDPDEHRGPADVALQQAFGLTKAEIRIARDLALGTI